MDITVRVTPCPGANPWPVTVIWEPGHTSLADTCSPTTGGGYAAGTPTAPAGTAEPARKPRANSRAAHRPLPAQKPAGWRPYTPQPALEEHPGLPARDGPRSFPFLDSARSGGVRHANESKARSQQVRPRMLPTVGVCLEFGPPIGPGCDHAMVAADQRCVCPQCGAVCRGRFQGCPSVWSRGPQPLSLVRNATSGRSVISTTRGGEEKTDGGVAADCADPFSRRLPADRERRAGVVGPLDPTALTELAQALADAISGGGTPAARGPGVPAALAAREDRVSSRRADGHRPRTWPFPVPRNDRPPRNAMVISRTGTAPGCRPGLSKRCRVLWVARGLARR